MNIVTNFRVAYNAGNILSTRANVRISVGLVLYGVKSGRYVLRLYDLHLFRVYHDTHSKKKCIYSVWVKAFSPTELLLR
jgi:hypothetical protein